jgi:hypothetical protein
MNQTLKRSSEGGVLGDILQNFKREKENFSSKLNLLKSQLENVKPQQQSYRQIMPPER